MEFIYNNWTGDKVDIINKIDGIMITPINKKLYASESREIIRSILSWNTPLYFKWDKRKELKARLKEDIQNLEYKIERLNMLVRMCERKNSYINPESLTPNKTTK